MRATVVAVAAFSVGLAVGIAAMARRGPVAAVALTPPPASSLLPAAGVDGRGSLRALGLNAPPNARTGDKKHPWPIGSVQMNEHDIHYSVCACTVGRAVADVIIDGRSLGSRFLGDKPLELTIPKEGKYWGGKHELIVKGAPGWPVRTYAIVAGDGSSVRSFIEYDDGTTWLYPLGGDAKSMTACPPGQMPGR